MIGRKRRCCTLDVAVLCVYLHWFDYCNAVVSVALLIWATQLIRFFYSSVRTTCRISIGLLLIRLHLSFIIATPTDVFHVSTCIQSAAKSPTKTFLLYRLCINIAAHYYASFIDSSFTVFCLRAIMLSVNQQKQPNQFQFLTNNTFAFSYFSFCLFTVRFTKFLSLWLIK